MRASNSSFLKFDIIRSEVSIIFPSFSIVPKGLPLLLDPRKVRVPTTVFVEITLTAQADDILDAFEQAVSKIPDVLECHLMAGSADYILKVVAEDTEDYSRIHRQHLTRLPGVAQMQSSFALRTVFKTTSLPI